MSILGRFGVDLGSLLEVIFGPLGAFSVQVGPGTIFEPSYLRKSDFSQNITFSNNFDVFVASTWRSKTTQDRSKTGPRSSWIDLFFSSIIVSIFYRFGISFGADLVSQMEAGGRR